MQSVAAETGKPMPADQCNFAINCLREAEKATGVDDLTKQLTIFVSTVSQMLSKRFLLIIDNLDSFFHDN